MSRVRWWIIKLRGCTGAYWGGMIQHDGDTCPIHEKGSCPNCHYDYYWQATEPGACDGCGYPTTHLEA